MPEKVTEISHSRHRCECSPLLVASLRATRVGILLLFLFFPSASYLLWSLPSCLTSDPLSVKSHYRVHPNVLHLCLVSFPVQLYLVWVLVCWHFHSLFLCVVSPFAHMEKRFFLGHIHQSQSEDFQKTPQKTLLFFTCPFCLTSSSLCDIYLCDLISRTLAHRELIKSSSKSASFDLSSWTWHYTEDERCQVAFSCVLFTLRSTCNIQKSLNYSHVGRPPPCVAPLLLIWSHLW